MSHRAHALTMALTLLGVVLLGIAEPKAQATPPSTSEIETQLAVYVQVQQALAADDFEAAQAALDDLIAVADGTVRPLAEAAAAPTEIEAMRAAFKPLSEYLAALELPTGYARAYCPMYDDGSNWVQVDGPLRNPYYGSFMLTCGVIDAAPGAHMDHTPQHGGRVFMAPDSFHHIEGTYPEPGLFRLYATDNYREPVDVTLWMGRAVLEEEYDAATDEFVEVEAFPLFPSIGGEYLEAEVGDVALPAEITVKVRISEDFPEERFDFIFAEYSGDAPATTSIDPANAPAALPLAERIRPRIPEAIADIVADIDTRNGEIAQLVAQGGFTEIFIPALQSKELALALNERADDLAVRSRNDVRIAVRSLVRAAWLLDWYGDLGNKQQVNYAYEIFNDAVTEITRIYGQNGGQ